MWTGELDQAISALQYGCMQLQYIDGEYFEGDNITFDE